MAKQVKDKDSNEIESVDLIAMLSLPEMVESYSIELREPSQEINLVELGKEELASEQAAAKVIPLPSKTQQPKQPANSNLNRQTTVIEIKQRVAAKPAAASNALSAVKSFTAIPGDTFEKIIEDISCCKGCDLCQTRRNIVPGIGNQQAKLVLIGEAPGADEDAQGIPFVGKAGQHLDKILAAAGFKKEELYICNILKCRPPNNRDPKLEEMTVCTQFLQRQLSLIKPKMIACLGNIATHYVIGPTVPGITRIHGQWFQSIFGIPTFTMYHPSYLIRSESREKGSPNWQTWQDIKALKSKYDTLKS